MQSRNNIDNWMTYIFLYLILFYFIPLCCFYTLSIPHVCCADRYLAAFFKIVTAKFCLSILNLSRNKSGKFHPFVWRQFIIWLIEQMYWLTEEILKLLKFKMTWNHQKHKDNTYFYTPINTLNHRLFFSICRLIKYR